jgi:hypothetical protein
VTVDVVFGNLERWLHVESSGLDRMVNLIVSFP